MAQMNRPTIINGRTLVHLRGWAIVGVLIIHATGPTISHISQPTLSLYSAILFNQLARFCVPMFFFLSGYLYARKFIGQVNYSDFIGRRIKSIGIPYLVWSFIYLSMRVVTGDIPASGLSPQVIIGVLIKGTSYGHLYFIPAIFQFYILLPFLLKFWRWLNENSYHNILIILGVCTVVMGFQLRIVNLNSMTWSFLLNSHFLLLWWLPFVFLGFYWADSAINPDCLSFPLLVLGVVILFSVMSYEYIAQYNHWGYYYSHSMQGVSSDEMATFLRPSAFLFALLSVPLIIYVIQVMGGYIPWMAFFGKYSFGIYLMHPLINKCVVFILKFINVSSSPWIVLIAGTTLTATIVYVMSKMRGLNHMIGYIR